MTSCCRYGLLLSFILFVLGIQTLWGTQMHVPEENPEYPFLLAMETRGLLDSPLPATRPWIKSDVAEHLKTLLKKTGKLRGTEREILQMLVNRYRPELSDLKHPRLAEEDSVHAFPLHIREDLQRKVSRSIISEPDYLFLFETEDEYLFLQGDGLLRLENKNELFRFSGHVGFRGFAQMGNVSVFGEAMAYRLYVRDGFRDDPVDSRGYYLHADSTSSLVSFDNTIGYIQLQSYGGLFTLGNSPIQWGYGEDPLFISGKTATFPYLMWQRAFYKSRYVFFHGSLMNATYTLSEDGHSKLYPEKYLSGHRFEIYPLQNLSFSFTELLVYGERNPELTYFIPVNFLWSAEHNLEDRDNSILGFEMAWQPLKGFRIHGSLLLDEFKFSEINSEWWGNKRGYQIGGSIALPGILSWEIFFEGTLVRPWTYSHYKETNTFTHKGDCLGFYAGPNARQYTGGARGWFTAAHYFSLSVNLLEKGLEPLPKDHPDYFPIGSNANQNYYDRNKEFDFSTKNLMGEIQKTLSFDFQWQWQFMNNGWLDLTWEPRWQDSEMTHYAQIQVQVKH
ncbi:MAG: hypothetical protein PWP06_1304 [Candidatus Marinimicrobia bacterium]|nr:hypothetical protein [Candidatus Neomarinimicrobiota bacterium]